MALRPFDFGNRTLESFLHNWPLSPSDTHHGHGHGLFQAAIPRCDVLERKDGSLEIKADIPSGMGKEDVHVDVSRGSLTISGERHGEKKEEGERWKRVERFSGSFSRSFSVPQSLGPEDVRAKFEKGVLTVIVPPGKEDDKDGAKKRVRVD